jgi:hypothetical protein
MLAVIADRVRDVLTISLAALFAWWLLDIHRHTCTECGRRWRHLGLLNARSRRAHTCTCGAVRWIVDP